MISLLLKFEAVESRIASHSCSRGKPGRMPVVRLGRRFQNYAGLQQASAIEGLQSIAVHETRVESSTLSRNVLDTETGEAKVAEKDGGLVKLDLQNTPMSRVNWPLREQLKRRKQLSRFDRIWGWKMRVGGRSSLPNVGEQDVLPVQFPDGVRVECSTEDSKLYQSLRTGNPHDLLKELMSLIRSDGLNHYSRVLQTIPANTFSEILRCLDPKHFVSRYGQLHREISPNYAKVMGLPSSDRSGYYQFSTIFLSQIRGTIKARQRDHPLSLSDYKYLLKCARMTGNIKAAREVWDSMTVVSPSGPYHPVTPDGECFKHYLGTLTWSDTANPFLRNRLRVIPDNSTPRQWPQPPYTLRGHRVGPNQGIKLQVSQIFHQMVKAGVPGDEETFCLMMMGFAREGDIGSVGLTLRRVWGVDVDGLITLGESKLQPVKPYTLDSPFSPTAKILHTISHAYAINNDLPTALRVVDFVSRQYNVRIPPSVWNELLRWTFILSKKRHGGRIQVDGTSIGQLPQEAVRNIWTTMISPPYNIKPSMDMYDLFISNLFQRQRFGEVRNVMSEARRLHILQVRDLSRQHILLKSTFQPGHPVSETRMRELQFMRMRVMRNREYIKKWVRLLIKRASLSLKYTPNWSGHDLPNLLKEWNLFIPKRVEYPIATGHIRFWTDVVVDNGAQQRKWRVGYKGRKGRFTKFVDRAFKYQNERRIPGWERRQSRGINEMVGTF